MFGPDGEPADLPADANAYWQRVGAALHGAEPRCLALAAGATRIAWYWLENASADAAEAAAADIARRLAMVAAAATAGSGLADG